MITYIRRLLIILSIPIFIGVLFSCETENDVDESPFKSVYNIGIEADLIEGSYESWLESIKGEPGAAVNFKVSNNYFMWQYLGDETWEVLYSLDDLVGDKGEDGLSPLFKVENDYLVVSTDHINFKPLLSLSTLIGETGQPGQSPEIGINNGYISWRYGDDEWVELIEIVSLVGEEAPKPIFKVNDYYLYYRLSTDEEWISLFNLETLFGSDGVDGETPLFRVEEDNLYVDYEETSEVLIELDKLIIDNLLVPLFKVEDHTLLVSVDHIKYEPLLFLDDLKGEDGNHPEIGIYDDYICWRYDDGEWQKLINIETLIGRTGQSGESPEIGINNGHISWRYEGGNWKSLFDLSRLTEEMERKVVKDINIDENNELIIHFTDGESESLGIVFNKFIVTFKDFDGFVYDIAQADSVHSLMYPEDPVKEGYTFIKWNEELDVLDSDVTLYALFEANTFSLNFDYNQVSMNNIEYGSLVTLPIPEKEGYIFDGWFVGESVNSMQFTNQSEVKEDWTLYARWEEAFYTVSFYEGETLLYSEEVKHGFSAEGINPPEKAEHSFLKWDSNFTSVVSDMRIEAIYEANSYTVSFDYENVASITGIYDEVVELPSITQSGFNFIGWSDGVDLFKDSFVVKEHIKLVPIFEVYEIYDINFDTLGGEWLNKVVYHNGDVVESLPEPTKDGFHFKHWVHDGDVVITPFKYVYDKNITLSAVWASDLVYEVKGDEIIITGYLGNSKQLILPSTLEGLTVTGIKAEAFKGTELVSINVPSVVENIGHGAFNDMLNLETLYLPHTFKTIDHTILEGSLNLSKLVLSSEFDLSLSALIGFTIPDDLVIEYAAGSETINEFLIDWALRGKTLILASDTIIINQEYLKNFNSNVTNLVIPEGVTTIEHNAFINASGLETIYLPYTLIDVGLGIFGSNSNITIYYQGNEIPASWNKDWNNGDNLVIFNTFYDD